jgi:Adenylate and Guanylate cyclase catalytic domain
MVATLSGWVNLTFRTFEQRQVPKLETAIVQTSLQVRVGIATGLVVVGDLIGSGEAQERGIVGETPNLAARLQAIAEPNMVVIAEGTQRLLGNLFELRDLGAKDLKGIAGSPGRIGKILDLVFSAFNMGPPFDPPFGFLQRNRLIALEWAAAADEFTDGSSSPANAIIVGVGVGPDASLLTAVDPIHAAFWW